MFHHRGSQLPPACPPGYLLTPQPLPVAPVQAVCFLEEGRTYVPPKPWSQGEEGYWADQLVLLPAAAQQFVARLREQQQQEAQEGGQQQAEGGGDKGQRQRGVAAAG